MMAQCVFQNYRYLWPKRLRQCSNKGPWHTQTQKTSIVRSIMIDDPIIIFISKIRGVHSLWNVNLPGACPVYTRNYSFVITVPATAANLLALGNQQRARWEFTRVIFENSLDIADFQPNRWSMTSFEMIAELPWNITALRVLTWQILQWGHGRFHNHGVRRIRRSIVSRGRCVYCMAFFWVSEKLKLNGCHRLACGAGGIPMESHNKRPQTTMF